MINTTELAKENTDTKFEEIYKKINEHTKILIELREKFKEYAEEDFLIPTLESIEATNQKQWETIRQIQERLEELGVWLKINPLSK